MDTEILYPLIATGIGVFSGIMALIKLIDFRHECYEKGYRDCFLHMSRELLGEAAKSREKIGLDKPSDR